MGPNKQQIKSYKCMLACGLAAALAFAAVTLVRAAPDSTTSTGARAGAPAQAVSRTTASWVRPRPDLAGKVLHWRETGYEFIQDSPDPGNGRIISGDIWLVVGSDGVPTSVHATYTFPDGSLYREVYETANYVAQVDGKVYASTVFVAPGDTNWCFSQLNPAHSSPPAMPEFVDQGKLASAGFASGPTDQPKTPPRSAVAPRQAPAQIYQASGPFNTWHRTTAGPVATTTKTSHVEVDTDGRLRVSDVVITDQHGSIIREDKRVYGDLDVYAAGAVPQSYLAIQASDEKGCVR